MPFTRAGQLARETPLARPDDPLGLVAENLRESHYGAIPVVEGDIAQTLPDGKTPLRLLGLIDEQDLSKAVLPILQRAEMQRVEAAQISTNGHSPNAYATVAAPGSSSEPASANGAPFMAMPEPISVASNNGYHTNGMRTPGEDAADAMLAVEEISTLTARAIMRPSVPFIPAAFSLHNALLALDRYECSALPVVDAAGSYRGMVSRADLVAALGHQVRPPVVGGMATPLGVWLTTGSLSGGAPPLGLFLSGATLAFCFFVAHFGLLLTLQYFNPEWAMMFVSGRLGALSSAGGLTNLVFTAAEGLLFLLVLRALPMAGVHAAEHQTVWAIERGLPLRPEFVKQMPRAHPRCGTNLVALAGLIQITLGHLPSYDPFLVLLSLLFIYFGWRTFGTLLQEWFTTRPPSDKQLESGIRAGVELMEKYQAQPHVMGSFGQRLFNSGILLSGLGLWLTLSGLQFAAQWVMLQLAR
jgi:CBS domain-containing protein